MNLNLQDMYVTQKDMTQFVDYDNEAEVMR